MKPVEKFIAVSKTARYYTYGNLSSKTKNVWIVFHGYGQLSKYFIKKFESLSPEENYVIALEGLSKFYLKGFTGRIGATWMTADMREEEIKDYLNYIDDVINFELGKKLDQFVLNVLGFSQGCHTATRWVVAKKLQVNKLILWSGSLPKEFEWSISFIKQIPLYILLGNEDELVTNMHFTEIEKTKTLLPMLTFIEFEGKHELLPSVFDQYFNATQE